MDGAFEEAGAKFVVPVAEHHDGFQMYDSEYSEWNAAKMGPKRNILEELKTEAEKSRHRVRSVFPPCGALLVLQRRQADPGIRCEPGGG